MSPLSKSFFDALNAELASDRMGEPPVEEFVHSEYVRMVDIQAEGEGLQFSIDLPTQSIKLTKPYTFRVKCHTKLIQTDSDFVNFLDDDPVFVRLFPAPQLFTQRLPGTEPLLHERENLAELFVKTSHEMMAWRYGDFVAKGVLKMQPDLIYVFMVGWLQSWETMFGLTIELRKTLARKLHESFFHDLTYVPKELPGYFLEYIGTPVTIYINDKQPAQMDKRKDCLLDENVFIEIVN